MAVDERTLLNENRERVHVRWTSKRGNEIGLIGQLNSGVTPRSFPGVSKKFVQRATLLGRLNTTLHLR